MRNCLVLTLVGPDKVGIIDQLTEVVLAFDGNVEESRMARLGGEFAVLMMISVHESRQNPLRHALSDFEKQGFQVFTRQTDSEVSEKYSGYLPYKIQVTGADHEGIVHAITHHLADRKINVEMMNTDTTAAPMSGTPLFSMHAVILVSAQIAGHDWKDALYVIGETNNVTVEIETYRG